MTTKISSLNYAIIWTQTTTIPWTEPRRLVPKHNQGQMLDFILLQESHIRNTPIHPSQPLPAYIPPQLELWGTNSSDMNELRIHMTRLRALEEAGCRHWVDIMFVKLQ